jgi:hypothetical protein
MVNNNYYTIGNYLLFFREEIGEFYYEGQNKLTLLEKVADYITFSPFGGTGHPGKL